VCSAGNLRSTNVLATACVAILATLCRCRIEQGLGVASSGRETLRPLSGYAIQTGLNVALFPVLFFFSGLYYTDIVSTLAVLVAYHHHLGRVASDHVSWFSDIWTIVLGIAALFMRQTNVFWVVVFMGGLEAAHTVKSLRLRVEKEPPQKDVLAVFKHSIQRWSTGNIRDPSLDTAWPDGTRRIHSLYLPSRLMRS
jgi:alpha-1,2-glucosyltransferase